MEFLYSPNRLNVATPAQRPSAFWSARHSYSKPNAAHPGTCNSPTHFADIWRWRPQFNQRWADNRRCGCDHLVSDTEFAERLRGLGTDRRYELPRGYRL